MDYNKLIEELDELMEKQDCSNCCIDCPFYNRGNYGKVCAIEAVQEGILELKN